jgi:hypothetical protein
MAATHIFLGPGSTGNKGQVLVAGSKFDEADFPNTAKLVADGRAVPILSKADVAAPRPVDQSPPAFSHVEEKAKGKKHHG